MRSFTMDLQTTELCVNMYPEFWDSFWNILWNHQKEILLNSIFTETG